VSPNKKYPDDIEIFPETFEPVMVRKRRMMERYPNMMMVSLLAFSVW
jgi:hypothetical protein